MAREGRATWPPTVFKSPPFSYFDLPALQTREDKPQFLQSPTVPLSESDETDISWPELSVCGTGKKGEGGNKFYDFKVCVCWGGGQEVWISADTKTFAEIICLKALA